MRNFTLSLLTLVSAFVAVPASAQAPFYQTSQGSHAPQHAASNETRAAKSLELSYVDVNETMWSDMGLKFSDNWRVGVAIVFPKDMLKQYVGAKVTHVSFGWNTTKFSPKAECFLRTSLDGENVATVTTTLKQNASDASGWRGTWNKAKLAEPYVIQEGEDLVIGYFADMKKVEMGESCIPFSANGNYYKDTQYIMNCSLSEEEGGNQWIDLWDENYNRPTSPLFATATLLDEQGNMVDLCELLSSYCQPIIAKNSATTGRMKISNRGTNAIKSLALTYTFGTSTKTENITLSSPIAPAADAVVSMPFYALGSGAHTVEIKKVNGNANNMSAPVSYEVLGVPAAVSRKYKMTPLIEFYCSENDYLSARYYEDILVPGLAKHGKEMIVVNQHMNDQFMTYDYRVDNKYDDATMMLIDFAQGDLMKVYMPVVTVNRTAFPNFYDPGDGSIPDNPAGYLIMPDFTDAILYEPALGTPTFAKLSATATLDDVQQNLAIKVEGDIADGVLPEGEQLYLTVYLMEDNVLSDSQEFPDDPDFIARFPDGLYRQQNVIRECLTPMYGTLVGGAGTFSQSFEAEIDDIYDVKNMRVVAMLSRAKENGHLHRNVINSTQCPLSDGTSIQGIEFTPTDKAEVYSMGGMRVTGKPAPGVYVVKEGRQAKKIIVK